MDEGLDLINPNIERLRARLAMEYEVSDVAYTDQKRISRAYLLLSKFLRRLLLEIDSK